MLKRLLPRTLFGRSLVIIATPIVVLQIVATFVFYERHWETIARRLAEGVAGEIAMVVNSMAVMTQPEERERLIDFAHRHLQIRITFLPGAKLPETGPIHPFPYLERSLDKELRRRLDNRFYIDSSSLHEHIVITVQTETGVLQLVTRDKRIFSHTTFLFLWWMFGTSAVLLAIAIVFLRNQMRPIRRLALAAEAFGKGQDAADFRPTGATEVRQAARAFLIMRDRIKRQINQRTEMLAGVSHDLRTPLTRMKLQLAMLDDSDEVRALKSDIDEMEQMVEGYLDFARGRDQEAAVETDLPDLLAEIVADARRQGAAIELRSDGRITLPLRPTAFKRGIMNLVENARRYAKSIAITLARTPNAIEIAIDDDGPGIPEDERESVFRPFHRLDESRNRETGGSGLGLTIARDVVRSHGGEITLTNAPSGGLRALIRLPV